MGFGHLRETPLRSVLERVIDGLEVLMDETGNVDIITFAEDPRYLNLTLYPRQRLILKLYYRLPLTDDELADVKYLLTCHDRYAKLYFPGLCAHHIVGVCDRKKCKRSEKAADYRILTDAEIRVRLLAHHAHILEVIAGRRGSKSALGAVTNAYELYRLLREPNAQAKYRLLPGQELGTANVATDEKQALQLFGQLKGIVTASKWFQKQEYRELVTELNFNGRYIFARSFHSNSSSVRGNTLIVINLDEFCHLAHTAGKFSDKAMWDGIRPSIVTFKAEARVVITSSPLNKAGVAWDLFEKAEEGETDFVIAFQFAAWEMNPTIDRDTDPEILSSYQLDADAAEMEYGGQWAEQVGFFIPPEAVDAAAGYGRTFQTHGAKGIKYALHVDLSKKRDRCGLIVCHYDKDLGRIIVDRAEEFDPANGDEDVVDPIHHEIDHQKIFEHIVALHAQYHFHFNSITFDQFNSAWLVQALRRYFGDIKGEWIDELTLTDKSNRELFSNLRTLCVQGGIELYHPVLVHQLKLLSKTIKKSGVWKVQAPPGQHDDLADALAAAAYMCLKLALGLTSGIRTLDTVQPKDGAPPPTTSSALSEPTLRHHKLCRPGHSCYYECPVARAQLDLAGMH